MKKKILKLGSSIVCSLGICLVTLALVSAIEAGAYADTESDGNADDKCKKGASVVYCQDHGCTLDGKNCGTPAESCPCV